MEQEKSKELLIQLRKIYNLLGETMDLSRQMAESLDRDDHTAFQMLLSMRRESIEKVAVFRETISQMLLQFPPDEAAHLKDVLEGNPGADPFEQKIAEQVKSNTRQWEQVIALDQRLSERVAHEHSVYTEK